MPACFYAAAFYGGLIFCLYCTLQIANGENGFCLVQVVFVNGHKIHDDVLMIVIVICCLIWYLVCGPSSVVFTFEKGRDYAPITHCVLPTLW